MTTITVEGLWRHPVKGIGREPLAEVTLHEDAPLPGDRAWAVLHECAPDTDDWQPRRNFLQVASGPALAAITAETVAPDTLRLAHPDRPDISVALPHDADALRDWLAPLWPADRPSAARLVRAPQIGMADNGMASLAILSTASLAALSDRLGRPLQIGRFRGNVVLGGAEPWAEFEWIGRRLHLGEAELEVTKRIKRCRATEANPETGTRDATTLAALRDGWGHEDFGVYARVVTPGRVATGDAVALVR